MKVKEAIINSSYFVAVVVFTLIVTTQSLARKVNTFQADTSPVFFYVNKQDIAVATTVSGRVTSVMVSPGDHVSKGELIVQIDKTMYDKKIKVLEKMASSNLSAQTELNMLIEQGDSFDVYAPQDGVVYKISVPEGSHALAGQVVVTIFADKGAKLFAYVTPQEYAQLQNKSNISVYSQRLAQTFNISILGIGKMMDGQVFGGGSGSGRKYEVVSEFENSHDGTGFIEQEALQLIDIIGSNDIKRPMERLANFWNLLIIGR